MATPPSSAAERLFRPPSRRPIGVRAPATMTEPDMWGLLKSKSGSSRHYPRKARRRRGVRVTPVSAGSHRVEGRTTLREDAAMTAPLDIPAHLFTCIDHVGIAVPDL